MFNIQYFPARYCGALFLEYDTNSLTLHQVMVYKVLLRNMLPIKPGTTFWYVHWVLLHAFHNTQEGFTSHPMDAILVKCLARDHLKGMHFFQLHYILNNTFRSSIPTMNLVSPSEMVSVTNKAFSSCFTTESSNSGCKQTENKKLGTLQRNAISSIKYIHFTYNYLYRPRTSLT